MCRFSRSTERAKCPAEKHQSPAELVFVQRGDVARPIAPTASAGPAGRSDCAAPVPRTSRRPDRPERRAKAAARLHAPAPRFRSARVPAGWRRRSPRATGCGRRRRPVVCSCSIHSGSSTRSWNSRPTRFSSSIADDHRLDGARCRNWRRQTGPARPARTVPPQAATAARDRSGGRRR